jgi:GntP family gluconate:H+ symporter
VVSLLLVIVIGVALVVALITWLKMPAFVGLLIGSIFVGLAARMPLADIPRAFLQGVGDTLGFTAIVIGLGTVIGKLLAESGGAVVVARALIAALGQRRLEWAIMLAALIVGLPVFFQVGLVLLAPVLFTLVHETKVPLLRLGIPMLAGLAAAHGLVPPHPGPLAAIERLGADPGRTLFYSLIVCVPAVVIAGPFFGRFITPRVNVQLGSVADQFVDVTPPPRTPGLGITLTTILLPVILMLLSALAQQTMADGTARRVVAFIGNPLVAMLVATLLSIYTFGIACGFDRARILKFADDSLGPIAGVLLVVGAGGGFGRVLVAAGADSAITQLIGQAHVSPLLLGYLIAVLLRLAVGSATVATITTASVMAPMLAGPSPVQADRDLLVIAIGAGSGIASHVNDGGFWLVKEYFNMSVGETIATWTVMETVLSIAAIVIVLLLALVVG